MSCNSRVEYAWQLFLKFIAFRDVVCSFLKKILYLILMELLPMNVAEWVCAKHKSTKTLQN
jgi:hypothetical protein